STPPVVQAPKSSTKPPVVPVAFTVTKPVTQGAPPWAGPKPAAVSTAPAASYSASAQSEPVASTLSLEDKVQEMVAEKQQARTKPLSSSIKKVKLPEFVD